MKLRNIFNQHLKYYWVFGIILLCFIPMQVYACSAVPIWLYQFDQLDTNHDKKLHLREWLAKTDHNNHTKATLLFQQLDKNNSQYLSYNEVENKYNTETESYQLEDYIENHQTSGYFDDTLCTYVEVTWFDKLADRLFIGLYSLPAYNRVYLTIIYLMRLGQVK